MANPEHLKILRQGSSSGTTPGFPNREFALPTSTKVHFSIPMALRGRQSIWTYWRSSKAEKIDLRASNRKQWPFLVIS